MPDSSADPNPVRFSQMRAAYMGGYVIGRSASFFAGDTAGFSNWAFAGFEAVMFVAALLLLMRPQK